MRRMSAWVLGLAAALPLPAGAQERETMGSADDYLMDRAEEVALARSAAPAAVSDSATVLVLTRQGYEVATEGANGFTCLVERSWSTPFGPHGDFYNPRLRAPICFNRVASRANLQEYLRRTALAMAGETWEGVRAGIAADIGSGALRPPAGLGMSYMMSAGQLLGTRTGRFMPHVMFYVPYVRREDIGASAGNGNAMMFEYEGGPFAAIIIPVERWIEVATPHEA